MNSLPKVSIITIVFNGEKYIEKTLKSICALDYPNIEFIIIDGGSKDSTLEIIKNYQDKIALLISEKDKGIYDAMNKGIAHATGEYLWFMNGGDEVYNSSVLSDCMKGPLTDVIYGDALLVDDFGKEFGLRKGGVPEKLTLNQLQFGLKVCHQSLIVRKNKVPDYDISLKYVADLDWLIRILKSGCTTRNASLIISKFLIGGFSKKNQQEAMKERFHVLARHFGTGRTLLNHIWILVKYPFSKP
jgi:glycosyltransferase involved in cell wall biosynthesis